MEPRIKSKPYDRPYGEKSARRHLPSTPEWGSPKWLIDAVVATMGEITTDPCTAEIFQARINALFWYTKEQNGLRQPWYGSVYVNPPVMHARAFWARLCDAWENNEIRDGMLISSYPDHSYQLTQRFALDPYRVVESPAEARRAAKQANVIAPYCSQVATCMFNGRVKFSQYRTDWETPGLEESKGARHGGNFISYLPPKHGKQEALKRFAQHFNRFGRVGVFNEIEQ